MLTRRDESNSRPLPVRWLSAPHHISRLQPAARRIGLSRRMIDKNYADAIKSFEGFTARSVWDYAQASNGYGTKAKYLGEVIDKAEAEKRFKSEIAEAQALVERFAPHLDDGSKAALTSLTYNAGTAWMKSGLGQAVGAGDLDSAQKIFLTYNKAGGEVLPGLVKRRLAEVTWFGQSPIETEARLVATGEMSSPKNVASVTATTHMSVGSTAPKSFAALDDAQTELRKNDQRPSMLSEFLDRDASAGASQPPSALFAYSPSTVAILSLLELLGTFSVDPKSLERKPEDVA